MEYFVLKPELPFSMGLSELSLTKEEINEPEVLLKFVSYPEKYENMIFQDYLSTGTLRFQYHIISDALKKFFTYYMPEAEWVPVVLIDKEQKQLLYWFLRPKVIDALHTDSTYDIGNAVKECVLDEAKIGEERIFSIQTPKQNLILLRMEIVEGILRRRFYGMRFQPVSVRKRE